MAKKRSGEGWSFRPADRADQSPKPRSRSLPAGEQRFRVECAKRAKGKVVTVVRGLVLTEGDLKKLGKGLKAACGTGGTIRSGEIELQGDCRERARSWLAENGWGV